MTRKQKELEVIRLIGKYKNNVIALFELPMRIKLAWLEEHVNGDCPSYTYIQNQMHAQIAAGRI